MSAVIRTAYAGHLATAKLLNRPYVPLVNSTLNQKFNLFKDEVHNANEYPKLGYIAIGNKGATYEVTTSGYVLTNPIPHLPRDASLYNFIPFVLRNINNDLSSAERIKYRMRVPMDISGTTYVAYYLRTLSIDNIIPTVELRSVSGENITTTVFTPTLSDLSPSHPSISNINLNNPNGDYLVPTAKINFVLNESDIANIMDACAIIFGDPRYAVINEIALCTGVDKTLQGVFGNTTSNYTDSIVTQIAAFISQYHALTSNTTQINIDLQIGSSEPLFVG